MIKIPGFFIVKLTKETKGTILQVWRMIQALGKWRKAEWERSLRSISSPCSPHQIQPSIMDEMNATFTCKFTLEEVHQALKQMAPTTAPGPDGMSPIFYKSFWKIVGDDVTKIVLNALNMGVVHESLNATFISLIPKVKNPKWVFGFRPISLCNVVYKLISKVLVNGLKQMLHNIVFDSQSAFLSGRLITDNVCGI